MKKLQHILSYTWQYLTLFLLDSWLLHLSTLNYIVLVTFVVVVDVMRFRAGFDMGMDTAIDILHKETKEWK